MQVEQEIAWAIDPASPIVPQICKHLRDRIIRNELTPGNRISKSEIARACDVSRQPVREAFIRLAEQGLITVWPQRRTVISKIVYSAVLDARFMREAIEADIVKILATAPDPALIAELRTQLARQAEVADSDRTQFIRLDERFHRSLAGGAKKANVWRVVEGLKSQMDRVRFLALGQFPAAKLVEQHRSIVDRIEEADVAGANAAMREHLRELLKELPETVAAHPDFFELPAGQSPSPVNAPIQGGEER